MSVLKTEDLLFDAMDRQALRLIEMLDDQRQDEDGNPVVDVQLKMRLFQMGQDWLIKRKKLKPTSEGEEGDGIKDMRAWINDSSTRQMLRDTMYEEGFVRIPDPKKGRPTKQEAEVRERYKAFKQSLKKPPSEADDSGWQDILTEEESE